MVQAICSGSKSSRAGDGSNVVARSVSNAGKGLTGRKDNGIRRVQVIPTEANNIVVICVSIQRVGNELTRRVNNIDVLRVISYDTGEKDRTADSNVGDSCGDAVRTSAHCVANQSLALRIPRIEGQPRLSPGVDSRNESGHVAEQQGHLLINQIALDGSRNRTFSP